MSTPILATKLYIPQARTKLVRRGRLIKLLDQGLQRKLTLVSAPAGFGKTTVVSEWVADCGQATAWLSLDEGDNDPIRFLTYFVAALQTITPTIGEWVLSTLQSTQAPLIESILTVLLNEIATLSDNFLFVLDDYHLTDAKLIDDILNFVLEHLPPQMHLVITSREDPNLPLARLRARSQLTELRVSELRFTADEAAEFLNQVMGLKLSPENITALDERTEGWIAGLQLAAVSMQGHQDLSAFIQSFTGSHHFVLDYLLEEVLHQQSESIQNFLLFTSILDRLCGSLCDAILLDPAVSGQTTLEYIEHANLFIIPLDSERRWYRYHHLFADLLRQRLLQNSPSSLAAEVAEFHRRASLWYEDNDLPADSIHHALAAKDFVRAAQLVELAWPAMDGSFQSAIWLAWAKATPDDLVRARPVLSVAYGWALLNKGELEAAELRFLDAERCLDTLEKVEQIVASSTEMPFQIVIADQKQFQTLPASIATARAYMSQARGDITGSIKYGLQALKLLPKEDHLRRGPAAALLALAQWASGDLDDAYQTLSDAMANFQKIGSLHFAISVTYGLVEIKTTQGHLREAVEIYKRTLHFALSQGKPLLRGTADLYLGLSDLYREQGDMDAAIQNLLQSETLSEQFALADWRYRFCRTQARFKLTQGDMRGALELLDEAEQHFFRTPLPNLRPISALRTRIWLAQGNLSQARRWIQEMELSVNDTLSYLHEFEHITLARVLLAEYRHNQSDSVIHETIRLLNRLLQAAQAGKRMGSVIEIGILQALAHQSQAKLASALPALERSLRLAEPEGYIRIFLDEGIQMAQLLSAAAAQGIMPDYTAKLLAAFEAEQESKEGKSTRRALASSQSLIEPLSERELEILQLIAQGLSNREISEKLYLALDTVKGYNGRIFAKLAVQRRTEAVARARDLGLLEA